MKPDINRHLMKNFERLKDWAILNNEAIDAKALFAMIRDVPGFALGSTKYYFGCGHDASREKYQHWFCSDLRDIPNTPKWNSLLGHPFEDGVLDVVKSKLAIGMFTYSQAKFIIRETARVLSVGGTFVLTYRDFDELLLRKDALSWRLFNRYLHGSGLYNGSLRKTCWTREALAELAAEYQMGVVDTKTTGMNCTLLFLRDSGKLKKYGPEPKVKRDDNGNVINDGGDFPGA